MLRGDADKLVYFSVSMVRNLTLNFENSFNASEAELGKSPETQIDHTAEDISSIRLPTSTTSKPRRNATKTV
jgi:hypothetical protein